MIVKMNKKVIIFAVILMIIVITAGLGKSVYATNEKAINEKTESTLVELKEKELSSLEDYKKAYGSDSYGITAYILNRVRIFSIPFTILGIMVAAVYDYIIGVRHLETKEKGQALMIMFVTLGIICQVLPLVFTIVVKFGRE
jgi:hypothetical protein